ncbi:MAG: hypothetical protein GEEBNDBF_02609 [bacterium]|nr:hypothetical protein [bacterium]
METLIGQGAYTLREAGRILGRPKRWVEGWLKSLDRTKSGVLQDRWVFEDVRLLTFADLIELYLISEFQEVGIKRAVIRKAAQTLTERYNSPHPFSLRACFADVQAIFFKYQGVQGELNEDASGRKGQLVIPALLDVIRHVETRLEFDADGKAIRFWPMATGTKRGLVVLDPMRQMGRPIVAACGVSTRVLDLAVKAEGVEYLNDIAKSYRVSPADVRAAVEYEESLLHRSAA